MKPKKPAEAAKAAKTTRKHEIDSLVIAEQSEKISALEAEVASLIRIDDNKTEQLAIMNRRNDELYDQWQIVKARELNKLPWQVELGAKNEQLEKELRTLAQEYDALILRNTELLRAYEHDKKAYRGAFFAMALIAVGMAALGLFL